MEPCIQRKSLNQSSTLFTDPHNTAKEKMCPSVIKKNTHTRLIKAYNMPMLSLFPSTWFAWFLVWYHFDENITIALFLNLLMWDLNKNTWIYFVGTCTLHTSGTGLPEALHTRLTASRTTTDSFSITLWFSITGGTGLDKKNNETQVVKILQTETDWKQIWFTNTEKNNEILEWKMIQVGYNSCHGI